MFQLESAIRDWCDAIRDSGCEDEASIEELRDHLCCEIEQLQERGLSEEKAFRSAVAKLGPVEDLAAELHKLMGYITDHPWASNEETSMASKITHGEITLFTRQVSTMMKAGVPVVQSLIIVADGTDNPTMKDLILQVRDDVSGGQSLTDALRGHPDQFDDLYCDLVNKGEQSGYLEVMLDRIAIYKEKTEGLKAKITRALNFMITVPAVISGILLLTLAPRFGIGLLLAIAAFYLACRQVLRQSQKVRDRQQRLALRLPILVDLFGKSCIARYSRTLSITFAAGVPLVDALESVSGAAGNVVYCDAIEQIKKDVSDGMRLTASMKQTAVFPNMVINMVAVGEESGALDAMFDKAATYYEEVVDNSLAGLNALVNPIIMSCMGAAIIAMYLTS